MQKWEYTSIRRSRSPFQPRHASNLIAGDWDIGSAEMERQLRDLGEEGWELVAISNYSSMAGGESKAPQTIDLAGFTDTELWVFKRPQP